MGAGLSQKAHRKVSSGQHHTGLPRTCGPRGVSPKAAASSNIRGFTPRPPTLWSYPNLTLRPLALPHELPAPAAWCNQRSDKLGRQRPWSGAGVAGRLPAGLVLALLGPDLRYQSEPWSSHLGHRSTVASASQGGRGWVSPGSCWIRGSPARSWPSVTPRGRAGLGPPRSGQLPTVLRSESLGAPQPNRRNSGLGCCSWGLGQSLGGKGGCRPGHRADLVPLATGGEHGCPAPM